MPLGRGRQHAAPTGHIRGHADPEEAQGRFEDDSKTSIIGGQDQVDGQTVGHDMAPHGAGTGTPRALVAKTYSISVTGNTWDSPTPSCFQQGRSQGPGAP